MSLVFRSMLNELSKLAAKKKYLVFLILEVVICVGQVLATSLLGKLANRAEVGMGDTLVKSSARGLPLDFLSFFLMVFIPLVVFMAATDLFCAEFDNHTIKALLIRPISRFKIYISKTLAVLALSVFYLVFVFVSASVLELLLNRSIDAFMTSLGAYLLDVVPLIVTCLMAVFINQAVKSPTLSMFLCIAIYAGFHIIGIVMPNLAGLLFTGYTQWHKLFLGAPLPFGAVISKIGLMVGYGMLFTAGGFLLFDKKEA